ncbi:MAG: lipopolysaccharide biosynthesis protein [Alphaproteobacteria bacterium]|nr:lipopolysaccharide biosynthesis protein [Alphaproteobacteria bacterium]
MSGRPPRDVPLAYDELDLAGLGAAVRRRVHVILGGTAAAAILGLVFVLVVTPRFTGEVKVLIENQENYFTKPERNLETSPSPDEAAVASAIQLVNSRDLAREAIRALHLTTRDEFDPFSGVSGLMLRASSLLGGSRAYESSSPEDVVLDPYFERLTVLNTNRSRVLQIEFNSRDPELAARGANVIANLFIDFQSKAKREGVRAIAGSLSTLLADLHAKLAEAEEKAESFRTQAGLLAGPNNTTVSAQQLAEINTQLTLAKAAEAEANAKAKMLREAIKAGRLDSISDVGNNDVVKRLVEQRANLRGKIAMESRTLLSVHPRLKELSAQLADLENELRAAADRAARVLDNDGRVAKARVENLQAVLDQQKKTVGGLSSDEVRQRELDRTVKLLKDQLETNTTKYQEALARQETEAMPSDGRIISQAVVPRQPTFPKKVPVLIFATLSGFVLSFSFVVAAELLSGRAFVSPSPTMAGSSQLWPQAQKQTGQFQTTSSQAFVSPRHSGEFQASSGFVPDLIRPIQQRIEQTPSASGLCVLVTGAQPLTFAQGLTLARNLAQSKDVVLLDLEGKSADQFGLAALRRGAGMVQLLDGESSFSEVIRRDRQPRLHLVGRGQGGMLTPSDLDMIVDTLTDHYDHLIILAPPADQSALTLSLAPLADYVVVIPESSEDDMQIKAMVQTIAQTGAGEILVAGQRSGAEASFGRPPFRQNMGA